MTNLGKMTCKCKNAFLVFSILLYGCSAKEHPNAQVSVAQQVDTSRLGQLYLSFIADPSTDNISFYWRDDNDSLFRSIGNLKNSLHAEGKILLFAMNGGMYQEDNAPQGLFIQEGKVIEPLNNARGEGNFYLEPNGIFLLTADKKAKVITTRNYRYSKNITYATQSGPMLLIDGSIHVQFKEGSSHVHIRNGVGILPDGRVLFAMSKKPVNLYDFAVYFKSKGCKNALYLDGFVSRCYLPEKDWVQTDGNFGVIIGITEQ